MKTLSRPVRAAVTGAVILASFALRPSARAADPAASAAHDAGAPLPPFDAQPFGDAPTPRPEPAEWKPAQPVRATSGMPRGCNVYRVREWVKIHCSRVSTSSIAQLGGKRDDVLLFLVPSAFQGGTPEGGEVIFPVRRGDRRVFEWSTFGDSYDGPGAPEVAFMISEAWAPNDAGPAIVAQGTAFFPLVNEP